MAANASGAPTALGAVPATASARRWAAILRLPPSGRILLAGSGLTLVILAVMVLDPERAAFWEILHWDVSSATAVLAVAAGVRGASGLERTLRVGALLALASWFLSNVAWTLAEASGPVTFPSVADGLAVLWLVPAVWIIVATTHGRTSRAAELAVYLDDALAFVATGAVLLTIFGPSAWAIGGVAGLLIVAYPVIFLGAAATSVVGVLATREPIRLQGGLALGAGVGVMGIAYVTWIIPAVTGAPMSRLVGTLFSVGPLLVAYGALSWRATPVVTAARERLASIVGWGIGPTAVVVTAGSAVLDVAHDDLEIVMYSLTVLAATLLVARFAVHLHDRDQMVAQLDQVRAQNEVLIDRLRRQLEERERTHHRLVDASRMAAVGELAAAIAHEVNNPLTSVLGYADLLVADLDPDDPRRTDLEIIRAESVRVRDRLRSLLEFAAPRRAVMVSADIATVVAAPLELLRYHLERRGIRIDLRSEPMAEVRTDPSAIQQILINVVTELAAAMPSGGRIGVATGPIGDRAGIVIEPDRDGVDLQRVTAWLVTSDEAGDAADGSDADAADGADAADRLQASLDLLRGLGATICTRRADGGRPQLELSLPFSHG
jgi:signal transduction histidine kinase